MKGNILSVEGISKAFGDRQLFSELSFGLMAGEKCGLVAPNGSGKSTLLKIITGSETADTGQVITQNGLRIAYLTQESEFDDDLMLIDAALKGIPEVNDSIREYELVSALLKNDPGNEVLLKRLEKAAHELDYNGGWDLESRIRQMLGVLNLHDVQIKCSNLSGGQKKRLALASVLLQQPDLILLDEPTNHLDLTMIEWLERFIQESSFAIILITHDRVFLDSVCDVIIELSTEGIFRYKGDYEDYLLAKYEREQMQNRIVDKARNKLTTELEWLRRMPKARGTKSKARIEAAEALKIKAKGVKASEPMNFKTGMRRLGQKIIELKSISKSFNDKVILKNFSYAFKSGEKVAIIGANGCGKTSLLEIMCQKSSPDSGTVTYGETIQIAYYRQEGMKLNEDKRVIELMQDSIADHIFLENGKTISISQFLGRFNFPPEKHYTQVSLLSGGEKRRLYLLTLLVSQPNVLILDEPTNDLDLPTLQVLEDFLENFEGCLIIVSHDRYFTDRLSDHLFVFEGEGRVTDFAGNYSQYRERKKEQEKLLKTDQSIALKKVLPVKESQLKFGFKEKRELEQLTIEISELELEKIKIEKDLATGSLDHESLQSKSYRISEIYDILPVKEERWMELSLLQEKSKN